MIYFTGPENKYRIPVGKNISSGKRIIKSIWLINHTLLRISLDVENPILGINEYLKLLTIAIDDRRIITTAISKFPIPLHTFSEKSIYDAIIPPPEGIGMPEKYLFLPVVASVLKRASLNAPEAR